MHHHAGPLSIVASADQCRLRAGISAESACRHSAEPGGCRSSAPRPSRRGSIRSAIRDRLNGKPPARAGRRLRPNAAHLALARFALKRRTFGSPQTVDTCIASRARGATAPIRTRDAAQLHVSSFRDLSRCGIHPRESQPVDSSPCVAPRRGVAPCFVRMSSFWRALAPALSGSVRVAGRADVASLIGTWRVEPPGALLHDSRPRRSGHRDQSRGNAADAGGDGVDSRNGGRGRGGDAGGMRG